MWRILVIVLLLPGTLAAQEVQWQQLPGPYGGPVEHSVRLADGTLLAAQGLGGIWRSSDDGASWQRCSDDSRLGNFPSLYPHTGDTVYAGCFSGLFISENAGRSWSVVHTGFPVWTLATTPQGRLYAGSIGTAWRSLDGGATWNDLKPADNSSSVFRLARSDNGTLFVGSYRHGLQRSSNGGSEWELFSDRLPSHQVWAVHMFRGSELYVSTSAGVHLSTDGGYTWKDRSAGLDSAIVAQITLHGNTLYAISTDSRIFSADDADGAWTTIQGPGRGDLFHIAADDAGLWVSSDLGLYYSGDHGTTWSAAHGGMYHPSVVSLATGSSGTLFAGTDRGGVHRSTDDGATWELRTADIATGFEARSLSSVEQSVFAASYETPLLRSTDNGEHWAALDVRADNPVVITVAHSASGVLAGSTNGELFRSEDNGDSWTALSTIRHGTQNASIEHLLEAGTQLYAGTSLGLFLSSDDGATWSSVCPALDRRIVRVLGGTPDGAVVYAGDYSDLYRSADYGQSWSRVFQEKGTGFLQALAVRAGRVYLSVTDESVYESRDGGDTWRSIGPARTGAQLLSLGFDAGGRLLAGSAHHGVLRSALPLSAAPPVTLPQYVRLHPNYPHPFGPGSTGMATQLPLELTRGSAVTLMLHDVLGREVLRRNLGWQTAGTHILQLSAVGLQPGLYSCSVQAAGETATRKMIIR